jgi:hypothetical protein
LTGYTSAIGTEIVNAVIAYVNSTPIGGPSVFWFKVGSIANLTPPDTLTFNITSVLMARSGGTPAEQDVPLAFNEAAQVDVTTVTLSIP